MKQEQFLQPTTNWPGIGGYLSTRLPALPLQSQSGNHNNGVQSWSSLVWSSSSNYYRAAQYQYLHTRKTGATPWDIKVNIHFEVSLTGFIIDTDIIYYFLILPHTSGLCALMYSHFVPLNVFSTDVLLSILDKRTLY